VIRDYKFNEHTGIRFGRKRGRLGIYIASSLLAGVLVSLGLHDTEATIPDQQGQSSASPLAALQGAPEQPQRISAPLPIPAHQIGLPDAAATPPAPLSANEQRAAPPSLLQPGSAAVSPPAAVDPSSRSDASEAGPASSTNDKAMSAVQNDVKETGDMATVALAEPAQGESAPQVPPANWKQHVVANGETLSGIFERFKLSAATLYQVTHASKEAGMLSQIRPGQQLAFLIAPQGGLEQLVFEKSAVESLHVARDGDGYKAQLENKQVEHKVASISGTIQSSLFVDGQKAGLTDAQIMEMAEIFGWDIDFALEIRSGDQFRVVYDEQFVDGKKYRNGPILAAEFVNHGTTYQAFRYETKDQISYYDADGHSKRRAFIRTPIKFARITSRFTPKRWHPILKRWKSHKGVDYAAPTGTPIKVTGSGRVVFRGWQNGYGRVVIVQHSSKYKTVYAHMSKFRSSVKQGARVTQGQVIGYVGKSGWATGPHLHYEFRVNNVQRNPLTVKLPKSLPLPKQQLAAFKREIAPLTRKLASIRQATMVASADR